MKGHIDSASIVHPLAKGKELLKSLTGVVRYVFKHGFHDVTTEHDWIFSRVNRKREN